MTWFSLFEMILSGILTWHPFFWVMHWLNTEYKLSVSHNSLTMKTIMLHILHGVIDGVLISCCIGQHTYFDEEGQPATQEVVSLFVMLSITFTFTIKSFLRINNYTFLSLLCFIPPIFVLIADNYTISTLEAYSKLHENPHFYFSTFIVCCTSFLIEHLIWKGMFYLVPT